MKRFIEIQNFGWNVLTITAIITMLFTLFQFYGVLCQNKKIWQERSGESLSVTLFFMYCFSFIAFFFYGISKGSLAMTFNSLLVIPYIPIVIGLLKFKSLTKMEKIFLPFIPAVVPLMIFVREKDVLLSLIFLISFISLATQPMEMIKTGKRGAVNIKFIFIFSITSIFWLIYSAKVGNWVLGLFNVGALIVYALIIYLYYKPQKI